MPRKRTRTTTTASWTVDSLENAVSVLKRGGISVYKVSQQTGIPYSTLKKRYNLAKAGGSSYKHSPKLGRSTVFNVAQEEILANHLRTMSNKFYGLTREQFRKVCYSVAKQLGIEKRFNQDNQTAGKDWLAGFLQRHPDLSIRKATSNQAEQPHASPATSPSIFCDLQIETEIIQREAAVTPVSIPSTSSHTIRPIATPPNIDFANVVSIVSPLPQQLISQKQKPLKNKQHSEIITSTPMKAVFEEKKRKRTEKENKIKTIKKNKGNCDKENCVKGKCAKGKCIKKKHTKDKEIKSKKTTTRNTRIRKATKYLFKSDDENSSLDQIDENAICDDESEYSEEENLCAICLDLGKNGEMWYRCRSCGNWAHKECTGSDSPDTYICAFCLDP
ncbi:unnamed protein product [Danaus chrysippus]|uniref:(African queen) hypothetical protein n=1 Tax=Danaus chrysippus TaxID=151541 RepID=A0A8J2R173_9NEOP|nr:unnamed protein product [Danaus chrysippus]